MIYFQGFDVTVLEGSPEDVGIRGNETWFPFEFNGNGNLGFADAKSFRTQIVYTDLKLNMIILRLVVLLVDQNGFKTMILL